MDRPEHLSELNLVRALAMLGVLCVHATSSAVVEAVATPWLGLYNAVNIFNKFGTPTFIFLSSFVLFYNYFHRPYSRATISRFFRNRLLYIIVPYVAFSAIYFVVKNSDQITLGAAVYWARRFAKLLLTGHAHDHLYFIIVSIQFYIAFPFVLRAFQKLAWLRKWAIPIGFIIQWAFIFINREYLHVASKGSLCISWVSYFNLGVFFGIYYSKVKDWIALRGSRFRAAKWAASFVLWAVWLGTAFFHIQLWYQTRLTGVYQPSLYYEALYNIYGCTSALVLMQAAFAIYWHAPRWLVAAMSQVGACSFGIYLVHPLVLRYYRLTHPTQEQASQYNLWVLGGFACALLVSLAIVSLASKHFRLSWVLFGSSSRTDGGRARPQGSATRLTG